MTVTEASLLVSGLSSLISLAIKSGVKVGAVSDMIEANGGEGLTPEQVNEILAKAKVSVANIGPK